MRFYVILISVAMTSLSFDIITDIIYFSNTDSDCFWFYLNCMSEIINNFFELVPAGLIFFVLVKSLLESDDLSKQSQGEEG